MRRMISRFVDNLRAVRFRNEHPRGRRIGLSAAYRAWMAPLLAAFLLGACAQITIITVEERTALENQILGSFQKLNDELILIASVRGSQDVDGWSLSREHQRVLGALMEQKYNQDDVREAKDAGCLGERNDGLLELFDRCERLGEDEDFAQRVRIVYREENNNRRVIVEWVLRTNQRLARTQRKDVERVYYRLRLENARPGDKIQEAKGRWIVKQ